MVDIFAVVSGSWLAGAVLPDFAFAKNESVRFCAAMDSEWKTVSSCVALVTSADGRVLRECALSDGVCSLGELFSDGARQCCVALRGSDKDGSVIKATDRMTLSLCETSEGKLFLQAEPSVVRCMDLCKEVWKEKMAEGRLPSVSFIPLTDYYVSDEEQRLYINEIAVFDKDGYFRVSAEGASYPEVQVGTNGVSDYIAFHSTETKDFSLTVSYCYRDRVIDSHKIRVHVTVAKLPKRKYMFIGDSLTDARHIQDCFRELNDGSVTLYGTRGVGESLHEGRSSWGVGHYFMPQKGEVLNPFYNPQTETFDFSYYMAQNPQFSDVEIVNIFLGRNNGFNTGIFEKIDAMIASIHAFCPNITVTLMGAYNVAPDNSGTGRYLQSADAFNYAAHAYNKLFYERYAQKEGILLLPAHGNLDNKNDYTVESVPLSSVDDRTVEVYNNNVHPDVRGYKKLGTALSACFKYFLAR